jgi:hypothetical protein
VTRWSGDEHYRVNADAVALYILKCADANADDGPGLPRFGETGSIVGKRCGRTQNLR